MTDNGEILNEAEVDFLLSAAGDDAEAAPTTGAEGQTVTMRGDLEQINLADIFQTLAMSKMEGVLLLRNPLEERHLHCRDGYVRILMPTRVTARRLGQRLIQAGLVQPEQLRAALIEQRKEKTPLGELVVTAGLVTQEQVDGILGLQISEDLFSLFTWRHGSFEFWKGPVADAAQRAAFELCPEFEVNSLLLEVARRSDEWESILAAIGSVDEVPQRQAEATGIDEPSELHTELFAGVDGHHTYRDLAEQTTHGLFEMARAARDLVHAGAIGNLDDEALVGIAARAASNGQGKKALLLLQTLRDRPSERSLEVVQRMATALQQAGEKRLAGNLLLEAAQQQADAATAIDLAHRARDLAPYDPATLSYLRTVLLAHGEPQAEELEQVTLQLLDALLEADEATAVMDLAQDARATSTASAAVLVRLARAQQKARDLPAAVATWLEVAGLYDAVGDRLHALEAYEAVLRLDHTRKDVAKLVRQRRRTRFGRLVRLISAAAAALLVGGAGLVYWQESNFAAAVQQASSELDALLARGDRSGARERWEHWLTTIGACEAVEDMRNRIAFAEAAEQGRQQKLFRDRVNAQLLVAAEALGNGDLGAAFTVYRALHSDPVVRNEVAEIAGTRFDANLNSLELSAKSLTQRLPPEPAALLERRELLANHEELQVTLPNRLVRFYDELEARLGDGGLPEFLGAERLERARKVHADARPALTRGKLLIQAYSEALQRSDTQRRLDPMFKAAVEKSAARDFAGALALFRELEKQPVGDAALRAHFHEQVERHATIVRLLTAQREATAAGDFRPALERLRELRTGFPDLEFEKLVQLPLLVDSQPRGAEVLVDGVAKGVTPLQLVRGLEQPLRLDLRLDGFTSTTMTVRGDGEGTLRCLMALAASGSWRHDSMVEVSPAMLPSGAVIVVDRVGSVSRIDATTGARSWTFPTGDLSGLLTPPQLDGNLALVASLDGELRAIDCERGRLSWSLPDLPTEVTPILAQRHLVLATTDKRLVAVRLADRERVSVPLPESMHQDGLVVDGDLVITCSEHGRIRAFRLPTLQKVWERDLPIGGGAAIASGVLVLGDDHGRVLALNDADGSSAWQLELPKGLIGPPTAHGNRVLLTTPDEIIPVEVGSGRQLPSIGRGDSPWASGALVLANHLLVATRDGPLSVLDARSGAIRYRIDAARQSRLLAAGGTLFVIGKDHGVQTFAHLR